MGRGASIQGTVTARAVVFHLTIGILLTVAFAEACALRRNFPEWFSLISARISREPIPPGASLPVPSAHSRFFSGGPAPSEFEWVAGAGYALHRIVDARHTPALVEAYGFPFPSLRLEGAWNRLDATKPWVDGADLRSGARVHTNTAMPDESIVLPIVPYWPGFAANIAVLAFLSWLAFGRRTHRIRRTRMQRGECSACAYPLGSATLCPECGTHVVAELRSNKSSATPGKQRGASRLKLLRSLAIHGFVGLAATVLLTQVCASTPVLRRPLHKSTAIQTSWPARVPPTWPDHPPTERPDRHYAEFHIGVGSSFYEVQSGDDRAWYMCSRNDFGFPLSAFHYSERWRQPRQPTAIDDVVKRTQSTYAFVNADDREVLLPMRPSWLGLLADVAFWGMLSWVLFGRRTRT